MSVYTLTHAMGLYNRQFDVCLLAFKNDAGATDNVKVRLNDLNSMRINHS